MTTAILVYFGIGTAIASCLLVPIWHRVSPWPVHLRIALIIPMIVAITASWASWIPFVILFSTADMEAID